MSIELTEKLLQRAGGWQAWKEAKLLFETKKISDASWKYPLLRGKVREGNRQYLAGLRIVSEREMDNICTCRDSRSLGMICAHSLAIGLAVLRKSIESPTKEEIAVASIPDQETIPPFKIFIQGAKKQEVPLVTIEMEGSLRSLEVQLRFKYSNPKVQNASIEAYYEKVLRFYGFQKASKDFWKISSEEKVARFMGSGIPLLEETAQIVKGRRWQEVSKQLVRIEPHFALRQGGDGWLSAQVHFSIEKQALLTFSDIRRLLGSGRQWIDLKDGRRALLNAEQFEDIQETFQDADPIQESGEYRFRSIQQGYLQQAISLWTGKESVQKLENITLGTMEPLLRDYQKLGARWLIDLAQKNWGGLLADEMGLGKTIQALAAMEMIGGLNLVVCPSSLVWNWQREVQRFLPQVEARMIEGANRSKLLSKLPENTILITSYPLLRRDIEVYSNFKFRSVFLDEAQYIKNPKSQSTRAALALHAQSRFILTGTPVENSVRDLWSLFNFALPGYLGGKKDFEERYEKPLTEEGDNLMVARRLSRRISPFVKRRLKKNILTELPEELEQIAYCELTTNQKSIYESLRCGALEKLDILRQQGAREGTKMAVFTAILRLRQACCDLRLLGSEGTTEQTSAKLQLLIELLHEAQDGGHRVLVFSQFTSMLELISREMDQNQLQYSRLEGSTRDRRGEVERFQSNPDILAFLISIKAGGTGLNLTAADTVIHFDPWWNPAVEAQATDRAHRLGQKQTVNVIKLIAQGTIEERVVQLQEKKRHLYEMAFSSESVHTLNVDDFEELLG